MMDYTININEFEGPLDLLLHLIKQSDIDIFDISIDEITNQYLNYINEMEKLNLNIASEYLVMAAELIEMKSIVLLPNNKSIEDDEYEENPRTQLINKLILYKQYKDVTEQLKDLEEQRRLIHSKEPSDLKQFMPEDIEEVPTDVNLDDFINAFNMFLERLEDEKPLNTKITQKEYSVSKRSDEIKKLLKIKKKIDFIELFEEYNREFIIVTFLSVLELSKKQYLDIIQKHNFQKIYLTVKESD
ncbi:MAG: segregation/condensation protein A [Bacilli bacterium]|nr:segregation/condensation protein A [Bacilli bacterium]MDD4282835.1 segregation/condensation protein A [Bacilli bacterium]